MTATPRKAYKDWFSVVKDRRVGKGYWEGAALASTIFKVTLKDHEALVEHEV